MVLSIGNLFIDLRPTFVLSLRQYYDSYGDDDHDDVDANIYLSTSAQLSSYHCVNIMTHLIMMITMMIIMVMVMMMIMLMPMSIHRPTPNFRLITTSILC